MKKILFLILLFTADFGFSQKVNLNKEEYLVKYIETPNKIADFNFESYHCKSTVGNCKEYGFSPNNIESMVNINGLKKITDQGDVEINIEIGDFILSDYKPTNGVYVKPTSSSSGYYAYSFSSSFILPITVSLYTPDGKVIEKLEISKINDPEYYSKSDLRTYPVYQEVKNELVNYKINSSINKIIDVLTYNYGYPLKSIILNPWIIDSKKHPENDEMYKVYLSVKKGLADITNISNTELESKFINEINYLNSIETKYKASNKDDSKLRYSAYLLLSQIYYFIDKPEKSLEASAKLEENGYYPEDAKQMKKLAEDLLNKFKKSKTNSRHY